MPEPFTLKIFVPSGDPDGVRIIDRMNWTGRGIAVPRGRWGEVKARPELVGPGVYVLTGYETDELGSERVVAYVDQTDSLRSRIEQHDAEKDWWDRALLFLSTNDGLNRAHTTWLEWELIRRAHAAKRCRLENKVRPPEPGLIESEKADTHGFLSEMMRIAPVMGLMIFEQQSSPKVLHLPGWGTSARSGIDTIIVPAQQEGFDSVFLGSHAWWAIRVSGKYMPNLRWIAAYQTAPVAAVTHIAEIERFEPFGDAGKWRVIFKGGARALDQPVPFGNAPSGSMQGPRYTRKTDLEKAKSLRELFA